MTIRDTASALDRRDLLQGAVAAMGIAWAGTAPADAADISIPDGFPAWLDTFRTEALNSGISGTTLDRALSGVQPLERVLALDQKQPENTVTFEHYLKGVVSERRVAAGRRQMAENRLLLERVAKKYGVQPRFIASLWGIETDFGAVTGGFPVVASLATLAFASPRPALFRAELLASLRILDRTGWQPEELKGSWAGALGQTQFMPSSYLRYAAAYDHAGSPDIWHNRGDVFASIANYLSTEGWQGSMGWGRAVKLPSGIDRSLIGGKTLKAVIEWQQLGVRTASGHALPYADLAAGLVAPGGESGPAFLVYDNYRILMKWNHSTYFATAVSFLADRLQV